MQTLEANAQKPPLTLDRRIEKICFDLAGLDPGPLAELRRMDSTSASYGAPFFWRLCARYELGRGQSFEQTWAQIIQALAILTPKGRDEHKCSRHAKQFGLGRVLCDGADPGWPNDKTNPKSVYSEARFAQLLGSSGETRIDLVLRTARFLAARLPPDAAFDCTDIARLLLYPDDPGVGRKLARDYYTRLDGARRTDADDNTDNATRETA